MRTRTWAMRLHQGQPEELPGQLMKLKLLLLHSTFTAEGPVALVWEMASGASLRGNTPIRKMKEK